MGYVLDPICISTEGQVSQTVLQDFALSTVGIVCSPVAEGGGTPEGSWDRRKRVIEARRRQLRKPRTLKPGDDKRFELEVAEMDAVIVDLESDRQYQEQLQAVELEDIAKISRDLAARERVVFIEAARAERKLEELAALIEQAKQLREELDIELALILAVFAIFFH
jgi:hypothetical protein